MVDRVYNINLRSAWLVAPRVKRANSSVDFVRSFVKTNMKAEEVKISQALNEVLWIRGAKKPPSRIQVKVSIHLPDKARHLLIANFRWFELRNSKKDSLLLIKCILKVIINCHLI